MIWDNGTTRIENCAVFFRVREEFGKLSNMCNWFPLRVHGIEVQSTEALYQACRFPHRPDWQSEILAAKHAMQAKLMAYNQNRRAASRTDWDDVRVPIMRWCLQLKLYQHFGELCQVLRSTGDRTIVERSSKDRFWGAVLEADRVLRGENVLGMLLTDLRDNVIDWMSGEDDDEEWPEPITPDIDSLMLLGHDLRYVV